MNISDWVLIQATWALTGATLLLGIIALITPWLSEQVKRKVFAPKLLVLFEEAPPFCHLTEWRSLVDPTLKEPVFYFRLQVTNEGQSQIRLCEVVFEELWIYDAAGTPQKYPNFSPVNLRWVESLTPPFVNINPRRRVYCNIGHVSSPSYQAREERAQCIDIRGSAASDLRFVLEQHAIYFSQPNCLAPGKYGVKISLYSENTPSQEMLFQIVWSGKWQDSEPEMFRELVIMRVSHL